MDGAKIKELFTEKETLLREMLNQTKEIRLGLVEEDDEKVLKALERRQNLMEKVDAIDRDMAKESNGTIDALEVFAPENRLIKEMLQNIFSIDEDNRKRASDLRGKYSSEILKLKKTGNVMQSYGFMERPSRGGAFIDTKE